MKNNLKVLIFILSLFIVICSFAACGGDDDGSDSVNTTDTDAATETEAADKKEGSGITSVKRVTETDIEVYYGDGYPGSSDPRSTFFSVIDADGNEYDFDLDYGYGGAIFFDDMLTLKLLEPIPVGDGAPVLTLTYKEEAFDVPYEAYYKYEYTSTCGITIKGSRTLIRGMETLERAGEMVDTLLSKSPEIAQQMIDVGAQLVVFGKGEHAYYIPEHRGDYDESMLYVEGFGGYTCSITESNIWHWTSSNPDSPDPSCYTAYLNENILVHEFAHGVKIAGIDTMADQSLAEEYQMVYRHAVAAGLWPDSYAISNSDEFFATMSAIWFNVMNESHGNDTWDGVRGPINTRQELYNYDIDTYRFFAKIYPFTNLDGAWIPVPDTVTVSGLGTEEAPDLSGEEYTFAYPGDVGFAGVDLNATYKLKYADAAYILDTAASSVGIGLWWDYSIDHPNNLACTYNFELVPDTSPVTKDHKTTYTVYIKGVRDGYLYAVDGAVYAAVYLSNVPKTPTEFTMIVDETGRATLSCAEGALTVTATPADGAVVEFTDGEGCGWYLTDMNDASGNILFIHGGEANGSANGVVAVSGAEITLFAPIEADGKTFAGWRVSSGTVADASANETTFTMPDGDAVVWAEYE